MITQRILLGTVAHNQHVQNIAKALYDAGALAEYHTGGVDVWKSRLARRLRDFVGRQYPALEAKLGRRKIRTIPEALVSTDWRWEGYRIAVRQVGLAPLLEDWIWEHSELEIDRYCAEKVERCQYDAFMGVEFGALRTLTRTKELGKIGVVAFLSPHHATRERWVDAEYQRFPELLTPATKKLLEMGKIRDARRDEEAKIADIIHCASSFTADSLTQAGYPREKIIMAPLGCPPVLPDMEQAMGRNVGPPKTVRFLYSGPVSVRKGAHLLLEAWKKLRPHHAAELHFFGVVGLPQTCLDDPGPGVFFHGPVSSARIAEEYRSASVLVFPTLCDGFGMVVAEALANGLPVITTFNAGAADLVRENHNGWVIPPGNSDALAARMEWCIDNEILLEDMREPAREVARQWTWEDFRQRFLDQLTSKLMREGSSLHVETANCTDGRS